MAAAHYAGIDVHEAAKIIATTPFPSNRQDVLYETRKDAFDNIDEIANHIMADDLVLVKVSSSGITANNLALKLAEKLS